MNDIIKIDIGADELSNHDTWRAAAAEFLATLSFVFIGPGTVVMTGIAFGGSVDGASRLLTIALGHGLAIAVLVWATAHLSGGHINPAVTLAAFITGKIKLAKGVLYVIAQVSGAVCGAFLLKSVIPNALEGGLGAHALSPAMAAESAGLALLLEGTLTFFLVFVVFATAMDRRGPGNLAPLAIGLVVMLDHLIGVPLTGASMNPARTLGPAWAAGQWADHWIYWLGPMGGGVLAALVYQTIFAQRGDAEA